MDPKDHLSVADESAFYLNHQNQIEDPRYRQYAQAIVLEAARRFSGFEDSRALDFGCGPGPVVSSLLQERGIEADEFDPVFFPNGVRLQSYGLIAACEVVEHFRKPFGEFVRLFNLLRPGAWLVLQTERHDTAESFDSWYYRKDLTHVAFYSAQTFLHLAKLIGFSEVEFVDHKRVSLRKPL